MPNHNHFFSFWDYIHSPFILLFLHIFYNNFVHEIYKQCQEKQKTEKSSRKLK